MDLHLRTSQKLTSLSYINRYTKYSPIRVRFAANDVVRVSKARKVFRKGYLPGWTEEKFIIYKRYPTNPPTYVLQDLSGKEIAGRFYTEELQKIDKSDNDLWAIEKIIRTKGRGTSRQLFVKWVGFDDSFNSWIKAEWLKT
ncbi:chromo domain-containing protein [Trichonephila clavipes]|uniref:Chromo domain-containing protein n=1 Tax=Trichonephila clavipes TaxID=2585209 RepID=A0A8X6W4N2_TRICX|nr:chromo domain-containing protein [Trichonephila clavipes]